jgi:hypothetical protein
LLSILRTLTMAGPFPAVQGGGSLILAYQVKNKKVVVIGGGEVHYTQSHTDLNEGMLTLTFKVFR